MGYIQILKWAQTVNELFKEEGKMINDVSNQENKNESSEVPSHSH